MFARVICRSGDNGGILLRSVTESEEVYLPICLITRYQHLYKAKRCELPVLNCYGVHAG